MSVLCLKNILLQKLFLSHCRIDVLTNLLYDNSKGHYNQEKALQLKELAKQSIGLNNPAIELLNSPILTIPGVGYTLRAMIISEIGDIKRFSNPSKLLAFAGLDPVVKQSGDFQASSMKISKRGSTYLRYAIYRVAFIIIYNNETFHNYYISKRAQGKTHRVALGHVCNKLVRVIFKILTDETPFNLS